MMNITTNFIVVEKTLPKDFFVDDILLSKCVLSLHNHQSVAIFGKWGSGKKTLAKRIALEIAKEQGLNIRHVKHLMFIQEDLASTGSTVLILENPLKPQYTNHHNAEIFDCLHKFRANRNNSICFLIVLFHSQDSNNTKRLFSDAQREFKDLCPEEYSISSSTNLLIQFAEMKEKNISSEVIQKIAKDKTNRMGHALTMTLFLRTLNGHIDFLKDSITFVLRDLKEMVTSENINERIKFVLLTHMMLNNGEIPKTKVDYALSGEIKEKTNKEDLTSECIQQLLHSYMEETSDGTAYRIIHDVFTRCTLLIALNHCDKFYIFKKCDPFLLLDCIRLKTRKEQIKCPGKLIIDNNLDIGVPTELFPVIATMFVRRNEMMPMLNNVRLFEDREFQLRWLEEKNRFDNPKNNQ